MDERNLDVPARTSHYQYESLPNSATHIRLLKLSPFQDDFTPMNAELITVDLASAPQFVALSYVWGPETPLIPIYLDGKLSTVHQNLYAFLWHYLKIGRQDLLWTDALCINQNDPVEKGMQVGSAMGEVYRGAHAVIVWLGAPEPVVLDALRFAPGTNTTSDSTKSLREQYAYLFRNSSSRYLDAVRRISENAYWSRLWIVQEFTLSRKVYVQYGQTWLEWEDFFGWIRGEGIEEVGKVIEAGQSTGAGKSKTSNLPLLDAKISELVQQRAVRQSKSGRDHATLAELVAVNRTRLCKDARDRVYGLLALANQHLPDSKNVGADYQLTTSELFFKIVEAQNSLILGGCLGTCDKWKALAEALELGHSLVPSPLARFEPPGELLPELLVDNLSAGGTILVHAIPFGYANVSHVSTANNGPCLGWKVSKLEHLDGSRDETTHAFTIGRTDLCTTSTHMGNTFYRLHGFDTLGLVLNTLPGDKSIPYESNTARLCTVASIGYERDVLVIGPEVFETEADRMEMTLSLALKILRCDTDAPNGTSEAFWERVRKSSLSEIEPVKVATIASSSDQPQAVRELTLEVDCRTFVRLMAASNELRSAWRGLTTLDGWEDWSIPDEVLHAGRTEHMRKEASSENMKVVQRMQGAARTYGSHARNLARASRSAN